MVYQTGNWLLDRLPRKEADRLLSSAKNVSLSQGEVIFRTDGPMPCIYFLTTSVLGVVVVCTYAGKQVEATSVGPDGIVGLPVFLGLDF